eukprot:scaffold7381_cov310-Pinguiococcus_pyrenoidosus.AAC.124
MITPGKSRSQKCGSGSHKRCLYITSTAQAPCTPGCNRQRGPARLPGSGAESESLLARRPRWPGLLKATGGSTTPAGEGLAGGRDGSI